MKSNKNCIPDDFILIKERKTLMFVKKKYKDALKSLGAKSFSFSKNKNDSNSMFTGRGRCLSLDLGDIKGKVVIRRYYHGGLLGVFIGELFWKQTRPLNEMMISEMALKNGFLTVEVLAVIKHKIIYPFFKAEIVTKEIKNAFDLIQYIKESELQNTNLLKKKKRIIQQIAFTVQKMHNMGIYHGDLHLKNILLQEGAKGDFYVYIIDFDKSRLRSRLNITARMKNLYRLDRSVDKIAMFYKKNVYVSGNLFLISKADRVRFLREYMRYNPDYKKDWRKLIKNSDSSYRLHKLRWNVFAKINKYSFY